MLHNKDLYHLRCLYYFWLPLYFEDQKEFRTIEKIHNSIYFAMNICITLSSTLSMYISSIIMTFTLTANSYITYYILAVYGYNEYFMWRNKLGHKGRFPKKCTVLIFSKIQNRQYFPLKTKMFFKTIYFEKFLEIQKLLRIRAWHRFARNRFESVFKKLKRIRFCWDKSGLIIRSILADSWNSSGHLLV